MAELSKEDKAILNALVYIDDGIWEQNGMKLVDAVKYLESHPESWTADSEMKDKKEDAGEYAEVFHAVEKSPSLKQLEIVYDKDIDYKTYSEARILTLKNDGDPVVVFHGTSAEGSEGIDNISGAFQADTNAQQGALEYINRLHDKYGYERISVTGHSKGGNKAMYVTILSDYVMDCTAFDGQGFSHAFLEKYREQIQNKKDGITLISADRSIVNAFLFPVAGTISYVSTEGLTGEGTKLGPFEYHKPNVLFTVDADGSVQFRAESKRAIIPDIVNLLIEMDSVGNWIAQSGAEILQIVGAEIMKGPVDGLSLGAQIGGLLIKILPNLSEDVKEILISAKKLFGLEDGIDVSRILTLVAAGLSTRAVVAFLPAGLPVISFVVKLIAAVVVFWGAVTFLEWAIPALIKAGIEKAKAIGIAIGMAASWVGERLEEIGDAIVDGFHQAVDAAVRFGNWAKDAANAAKEAISNAAKDFLSGVGKFFESIGKNAGSWIGGIFGSVSAAIQYAQDIDVTMARIEEMQRHISNLSKSYVNTQRAAVNASSAVNRVYHYYNESYVRNCCRDIQNDLKNAQKYADMAQKELDRKRRVLLEASESYRRADQGAAQIVRNYA